jgi:hypothetical protein
MSTSNGTRQAFRALERALIVRRFSALEPVLKLELAAIALLVGGFAFWQTRIPLDHAARSAGAAAAAGALALRLGVLAVAGAAIAGTRHGWVLRAGPPGPEWLALPIPPAALGHHLQWGSALHARWIVVPAAAVLAAGVGVVPAAWLAALALGFAAGLWMLASLACGASAAIAVLVAEHRPGVPALHRVLARASRRERLARVAPARFGAGPAWRALARKDALVTAREGPVRGRALAAGAAAVLASLAWLLPLDRDLARLAGVALSLVAAGAAAEWIVAVVGSDPAPVLRALPVGLAQVWGTRIGWAAAIAAALVLLQTPAAASLEPGALAVTLAVTGSAAFALGMLGASLAVSLYPRSDQAQRLFSLWVVLALAASLMIPLLGWAVLGAATLHALRRIGRWRGAEELG